MAGSVRFAANLSASTDCRWFWCLWSVVVVSAGNALPVLW